MPTVLDDASIATATARIEPELIRLRREIHRHPELAGHELRTSALVAAQLTAAGLAVTTGVGGHGVVAMLDGGSPGPTIAYRADMDAVADPETFDGDFASAVPGVAHICGHDVHTAVGVGLARVLAALRDRICGRVVFLFQPAEEDLTGAAAMLADGVFDRDVPREVYAVHCGPLPVGTFGVMPGTGHPGQAYVEIDLAGPRARADAARLAAAIDGFTTVRRPTSPEEFAQLIAGLQEPDGPLARFVVADSRVTERPDGAHVSGWLRAWPESRYAEIRDEVRALVDGCADARVEFPEPFPAMVCSPELSNAAADYLRGALGPDAVWVIRALFPFNGEDFALFLQRVPGAMFYLGVANPELGIDGAPHSPDFSVDEGAVGVGVRAMAGFLADRLAS
ncbi:M20 metallopeptidase family protein [Catenulispora pinisilvae]|uniref:M20 metallopeptidase family protein n=1 Tax=Catenulispora pinisilvae TaxID=2705253 RepID=UPI001891A083|nr:amidohydrolase [Catenulispora pinisilvae]